MQSAIDLEWINSWTRRWWGVWLVGCVLLALGQGVQGLAAPAVVEPLDYTLLTHSLNIELLRAGAHSAKGTDTYTFVLSLVGLLNSSEERNLDFDKRKKKVIDLGVFGDTSIESLAVWKPDAKLKNFKEIKIDGQAIRELVAQMMTTFNVPEAEVRAQVDISMVIKKKKWLVLNADEQVAKASYAPVPATKFETGLRSNQDLVIEDNQGTYVKIAVRYDKPALDPQEKGQKVDAHEPVKAMSGGKKT